jgi:hypothetical protein
MSDRNKPHKGRDVDGRFKVRQADVDDMLESPEGTDYLRDDVRLGGAVEDTGPDAGRRAARIRDLVEENRFVVDRLVHPDRDMTGSSAKRSAGRGRRSR